MPESQLKKRSKVVKKKSTAYLRIGTRYRANKADKHYDAVVVGSGPGGLATAVCLSKMGWKVAVFEQHYSAGGFTHAYGRNGYEWDVGVHYIGDMGSTRTRARQVFDFVTGGNLKWASMGRVYDRVYINNEMFEFPAGKAELITALIDRFPDEQSAIQQYFKLVDLASRGMTAFTLNKLVPKWLGRVWLHNKIPGLLFEPTLQVLERLTSNKKLIATLTTQWGDAGLSPRDSSFLIHAIIAKHYLYGGYYPIGGASKIAETQLPAIQKNGGEVFTYARVEQILFKDNRAAGVRMADGNRISSPVVVSAVGVPLTFNRLIPEAQANHLGWKQKQREVAPSMSHLCLYIGLKHTAESLELPRCNFWIYPDEHSDANVDRFEQDMNQPFPLVYVSFPSAKDPTWQERYPGTATIEIVAPAKYQWFEQWKDETWGKRGSDYDALKEHLAERLLNELYAKLPQLDGKIDYWELSTPLSTQYFNEYAQGEIYGLDHNPNRFKQDWLRPKTAIKGFYLSGQDILTCGVVGGVMSGLMTSVAILGVWKSSRLLRLMKQQLSD